MCTVYMNWDAIHLSPVLLQMQNHRHSVHFNFIFFIPLFVSEILSTLSPFFFLFTSSHFLLGYLLIFLHSWIFYLLLTWFFWPLYSAQILLIHDDSFVQFEFKSICSHTKKKKKNFEVSIKLIATRIKTRWWIGNTWIQQGVGTWFLPLRSHKMVTRDHMTTNGYKIPSSLLIYNNKSLSTLWSTFWFQKPPPFANENKNQLKNNS